MRSWYARYVSKMDANDTNSLCSAFGHESAAPRKYFVDTSLQCKSKCKRSLNRMSSRNPIMSVLSMRKTKITTLVVATKNSKSLANLPATTHGSQTWLRARKSHVYSWSAKIKILAERHGKQLKGCSKPKALTGLILHKFPTLV